MVSIDPACGTSSAFSCAGSKSTTVTSRSSSGSHLLRAPDHHRPTKVALGNIVQALVERTFAWISRNRRLARDFERYARTVAAFVRTGSPEAVARPRFPQNVACGFPAPRSSAVGSQLSLLSVQVLFPWSADLLSE